MKMAPPIFRAFLSVTILSSYAVSAGPKAQTSDLPSRQINEFTLGHQKYWFFELLGICRHAQAPCGVELLSNTDVPAGGSERTFRQVPLATLLDSSIAEHPKYQWVMDAGVINIVPRDTLDNRISRIWARNPLDRKIKTLDIVDSTPEEAVSKVVCPEVGLHCVGSPWAPSGPAGVWTPPKKVSLHLKNITVRQALNELVRQEGRSIWLLWREPGFKTMLYVE